MSIPKIPVNSSEARLLAVTLDLGPSRLDEMDGKKDSYIDLAGLAKNRSLAKRIVSFEDVFFIDNGDAYPGKDDLIFIVEKGSNFRVAKYLDDSAKNEYVKICQGSISKIYPGEEDIDSPAMQTCVKFLTDKPSIKNCLAQVKRASDLTRCYYPKK